MKKDIRIVVQAADIRRFEADVIALKFAQGLFGSDLRVAKALEITAADMHKFLPAVGDLHLVPGLGRIKARHALFLNVGQLSFFNYVAIRKFCFAVMKGLENLAPKTRHLAMTIQRTGYGLDVTRALQAEIEGCKDALREHDYSPYLEKISIVERDLSRVKQIQSALSEVLPDPRIEVASVSGSEARLRGSESDRFLPSGEGFDVFLCYKSEDTIYAREVAEILRSRGLNVFFSRESLPRLGSDGYRKQIDHAIESARHMVVVTTSGEHAQAKWVEHEWGLFLGEKLAGRKKGNLVTVIAGNMGIEGLPISLRNREVIRLVPDDQDRLFEYVKSDSK